MTELQLLPFDRDVLSDYLSRGCVVYYVTVQDGAVIRKDLLEMGISEETLDKGLIIESPDSPGGISEKLCGLSGENKVYIMTDSMKSFYETGGKKGVKFGACHRTENDAH